MTTSSTTEHDLRVNLLLRIWIGVECLFGVLSILTISLSPAETKSNFSWPIQPVVTAALLGAFYVAAASFYLLSLFARRWENIRVFIWASILFSSVELIATFLHWDRFSVGSLPFNVWFVSYILPPPLFIAFYFWHQQRAAPIPKPSDEPLPANLRLIMRVLGAVLALFALAAFIVPASITPLMPWTFSPLTLRALSGWILALGVMNLAAAHENDRTRVRIISPFFVLLLPTILLEVVRYGDQVNWSHPAIWVGLAVLAVTFAIGLYLIRGDWRKTMQ